MNIDEILIKEDFLTVEEQEYYDRFKEYMERINYIPESGEVIKQCLDEHYYKPYWFISNKARLISVYREENKGNHYGFIKPWLKPGGHNKKDCAEWTDYIKSIYPQWQRDNDKGHEPSCYYWGKRPVQEWILYYFGRDEDRYNLLYNRTKYNIHHKIEFDWSRAQQYSNRIDNLQGLIEDDSIRMKAVKNGTVSYPDYAEKKAHSALHAFGKKDVEREYIQALLDGKPMLYMDTLEGLIEYNLRFGQAFIVKEYSDGTAERYVHMPDFYSGFGQ